MKSLKLFNIDPITTVQKTATLSISLSNPPEDWDQEILDNALKTHPWLVDFALEIEFIKKLPDRQYGLGSILVRPKATLDVGSSPMGNSASSAQNSRILAHIPLIIREGELAPIDIFLSGEKVFPLNEDIFRSHIGDSLDLRMTTTSSSNPTLIGHLWPPGRFGFGLPSMHAGIVGTDKFAAKDSKSELFHFERAIQKLAEEDIDQLNKKSGFPILSKMASRKLRADFNKVSELVDVINSSSSLRSVFGEVLHNFVDSLPPPLPRKGSVVQILKTADGYSMRSTDPKSFSFDTPIPVDVSKIPDSSIFTSLSPTANVVIQEKTAFANIDADYGLAYIRDGHLDRKGVLFKNVIDFNGESSNQMLFTDFNRSNWSLEPSFNAVQMTKIADIRQNQISKGTGVFVFSDGGKLSCSIPITIHKKEASSQGPCYKATLHSTKLAGKDIPLDMDVKLFISPAVVKPLFISKSGSLLVPADVCWMHIGERRFRPYSAVTYTKNAVEVSKLASDEYLFSGLPVRQVVSKPINTEDSQLLLAALGVAPTQIDDILKKAEQGVTLCDCNVLRPKIVKKAELPIKVDIEMLKAAAILEDPNSIDAVLGLNMMDSEADDNYIILAQNLEEAQQKVARLLLMKRLGLASIPEGPAKIVMVRLTPIIDALKVLAMQAAYEN